MAQLFQVVPALPKRLDQELCLVLGPSLEKLHWCQLASRRRGRLIPWQLQSCPGQGMGARSRHGDATLGQGSKGTCWMPFTEMLPLPRSLRPSECC